MRLHRPSAAATSKIPPFKWLWIWCVKAAGNLINQLQQGGLGSALESWISTGSNQSVSGNDLQSALGSGLIEQIASKFGMNGSQTSDLLAQYLPNLVDSATPNGSAQDADGFGLDDLAALVLKNLIK